MPLGRRDFLHVMGTTLAGCAAGPAARPRAVATPTTPRQRILILGGTGFLGPAIVSAARARGHTLTLFNRGKTNPGLFPDLETIIGDRRTDIERLGGRRWDAVVDTWVMLPRSVRAITRLLKDSIDQYVFVSTISVYVLGRAPIDESSPTLPPVDDNKPDVSQYGHYKAMCDRAAEEEMPGRATVVRAGVLVGPGDPTDRFVYWPLRLARGGEVLVPGRADDRMQLIDCRDLGAWIVTVIERRATGVYNAVGPEDPSLGAVLASCRDGVGGPATFTWVDGAWLEANRAGGWNDFPLAVLAGDAQSGFGHVSANKAIAAGLRFRSPAATAKDTLTWWNAQSEERRARPRPGMTAAREAELLAAWRRSPGRAG
jgi:2'-hydroxyisoflavone reductase